MLHILGLQRSYRRRSPSSKENQYKKKRKCSIILKLMVKFIICEYSENSGWFFEIFWNLFNILIYFVDFFKSESIGMFFYINDRCFNSFFKIF